MSESAVGGNDCCIAAKANSAVSQAVNYRDQKSQVSEPRSEKKDSRNAMGRRTNGYCSLHPVANSRSTCKNNRAVYGSDKGSGVVGGCILGSMVHVGLGILLVLKVGEEGSRDRGKKCYQDRKCNGSVNQARTSNLRDVAGSTNI